jgi:hypothetical protein
VAELKTKPTKASVAAFIKDVDDPRKREDAREVMALMKRLGKYKTGKSCLYLKNLNDVDRSALRRLVARSVDDMKKMYDCV